MKPVHSMIAALALAFVLSAAADAAQGDPEVIIYRFPGVRDNGDVPNAGVATVFYCTNFSGGVENIRFVTRAASGALIANVVPSIAHLQTITATTRPTLANVNETPLNTGAVDQGTTAIAATSTNIICTAMTIDASTVAPVGIALRGIRFAPVSGSQE
jgi:hypothetical protein